MNFETFNFHPSIMAGVRALGYSIPTPIQEQAIPPIMQGRDLIGLAQTGTGKTAAFALPIMQRLLEEPRGRIQALVISPTRELAEQTSEAFIALGKQTGLRLTRMQAALRRPRPWRRVRPRKSRNRSRIHPEFSRWKRALPGPRPTLAASACRPRR